MSYCISKDHSLETFNQQVSQSDKDEGIQRSTSFKTKSFQRPTAFGCSHYGKKSFCNKNEISKENHKSPMKKVQFSIMNKTTNNWNHPINNQCYKKENHIIRKNIRCANNKYNMPKLSPQKLPDIYSKEDMRFNPIPVSEKRDEYIRYILNNRRKRYFNYKPEVISNNTSMGSTRKNTDIQAMNIEGINFEIHSKDKASPEMSLDYLKNHMTKEMNLMCYDFNGIVKRMNTDSSQQRNFEKCLPKMRKRSMNPENDIRVNKTTGKFFSGNENIMRLTVNEDNEKSVGSFSNMHILEDSDSSSLSDIEDSNNNSIQITNKKNDSNGLSHITLKHITSKSNFK